jgi:hypothetical protein
MFIYLIFSNGHKKKNFKEKKIKINWTFLLPVPLCNFLFFLCISHFSTSFFPFTLFIRFLFSPPFFPEEKTCFFAVFYKLQDSFRPSHYLAAKASSLRVSILGINSLRSGKNRVHLYFHFTVLILLMAWTGSSWLRIRTGEGHLWKRYWIFGFHKMQKISWLGENRLLCLEGLGSMK